MDALVKVRVGDKEALAEFARKLIGDLACIKGGFLFEELARGVPFGGVSLRKVDFNETLVVLWQLMRRGYISYNLRDGKSKVVDANELIAFGKTLNAGNIDSELWLWNNMAKRNKTRAR